ncbi:PAP2-domain-containing protein [Hyaloscypha variabilis F]|uniref:PAP2-domain-containing protein n=1 Tax=Hyaloscypha variabilis (strain UAMH 11265 / GT02V1 / F) TaxID=1149755 RepID=A0A2J6R4F1_HYAVF|nr:PAP2-domain-containing protein [Hyaloscypha variabilis F]
MASRRLVILNAIDWLVIIAAITISLLLSTVNPDMHTFCVLDMTLSYPSRSAKLSLPLFITLSIVFPLLTIIYVSLFTNLRSHPPTQHHLTYPQKLKLLNASLLGLGVSLATSTVIFTGVKNLTGKARPNFLSTCDPDLEKIESYTVGGFGAEVSRLWVMVDVEICRQIDKAALRDGFRSFPSGFATIAFAGLWYLSLFLCHRFGVGIPTSSTPRNIQQTTNFDAIHEDNEPLLQEILEPEAERSHSTEKEPTPFPVYLLLLPYIPLGLAIFIAGTRYFDFRNHGLDVLVGAAIGSVTASLGFRMYHPSLWG